MGKTSGTTGGYDVNRDLPALSTTGGQVLDAPHLRSSWRGLAAHILIPPIYNMGGSMNPVGLRCLYELAGGLVLFH